MKMLQSIDVGACLLRLMMCRLLPNIQATWCLSLEVGLRHGEAHMMSAGGEMAMEGCSGVIMRCCDSMWYVPPSQDMQHEKLMRPNKHCK